jgi:hypothetical protein
MVAYAVATDQHMGHLRISQVTHLYGGPLSYELLNPAVDTRPAQFAFDFVSKCNESAQECAQGHI